MENNKLEFEQGDIVLFYLSDKEVFSDLYNRNAILGTIRGAVLKNTKYAIMPVGGGGDFHVLPEQVICSLEIKKVASYSDWGKSHFGDRWERLKETKSNRGEE